MLPHLRFFLFVILLLLIGFVGIFPVAAQGVCTDDDAEIWTTAESDWLGVWTEQPDGSFVALWSRPGEKYETSLTISVDAEGGITIDRDNSAIPGLSVRGDCIYTGALSASGTYVSGTITCELDDGATPEPFVWLATISCAGADTEPTTTEATFSGVEGDVGALFSFVCAPITDANPLGRVYGTDYYTDDSSICTAAVHAGAISTGGGRVTVQIREGANAYESSEQNGVSTLSWSTWGAVSPSTGCSPATHHRRDSLGRERRGFWV